MYWKGTLPKAVRITKRGLLSIPFHLFLNHSSLPRKAELGSIIYYTSYSFSFQETRILIAEPREVTAYSTYIFCEGINSTLIVLAKYYSASSTHI